jgi:ketol-acid reductoisomerase
MNAERNNAKISLIEKTGNSLREMMPWITDNSIIDQKKN